MTTVTITNAAGKTKDLIAVDLTGSEKQIAWATTMRTEFFSSLLVFARMAWDEEYKGKLEPRDYQALCTQAQEWYLAQDNAGFWIDNRDDGDVSFKDTIARFANKGE